ncbi:hypothetical protein GA0116948_104123 [Chitinophaga costaii]|uniref:Uncharacterized protein n=1 Tax=Chitinophaga costaii TaxID=1335309 RepID=A0A1C4CHC6_9BACT|nr:hypothetical protein GA0116948_104123 [Chitinophaga costaii]
MTPHRDGVIPFRVGKVKIRRRKPAKKKVDASIYVQVLS